MHVRGLTKGPDPPTLAFLTKKSKGNPEKNKGFLFAEPLKSLEKRGKTPQKKQGKSENEKSKEIRKSKDWRVRAVPNGGIRCG